MALDDERMTLSVSNRAPCLIKKHKKKRMEPNSSERSKQNSRRCCLKSNLITTLALLFAATSTKFGAESFLSKQL